MTPSSTVPQAAHLAKKIFRLLPPAYPWLTGPLTIDRVQVTIAHLPPRLRGLRIVQLSDFHCDGWQLSETLLHEAIATVNQIQPDLICLTGDFVTTSPEPAYTLAKQLHQLRSPLGTFACLGNHDLIYPHSQATITQALEQVGIHVLWNQAIYPEGLELAIVGLADFWSREFNPAPLLGTINPELPRLVLSHNPDSAAALKPWRVDLQLSGHSHGGQINLPGLGSVAQRLLELSQTLPALQRLAPIALLEHTMQHWEWSQGLYQLGQNQLYVNRGLGTYPPGRLFCPPEVTVITLS